MFLFQTVFSGCFEKFAAVSHVLLQQFREIRPIVPKRHRFWRFFHGNTRMGKRSAISGAELLRGDYARTPQIVQKQAVFVSVHMRDIILLRQGANHVLFQRHRGLAAPIRPRYSIWPH